MHQATSYRFRNYHLRIMAALAATLALVLAAFRFWPVSAVDTTAEVSFRAERQEVIEIEEIRPTRQTQDKPPPPAPPIPVLVPDDEILTEDELDLSDYALTIETPEASVSNLEGAPDDGTVPASSVMVGPRTVRFVEPEYTREARRKKIRAELVVEVLVDEQGRVQNTRIVERFLIDGKGDQKTPVDELGYGLEEAAISAAERWIFRPARKDGQAVVAYTTLTFTFGV